ncbi:hypothetical protein C1J01_14295 [Nonomuraea aridisoli]|uniref:Uncharacterized protein n=1 Tax=Nonomuraea aridisoli TaxID=2070368 RepID=A0A2W2E315_9ACTN|nr:hypothetical protein C1J01_14295 [Nonomuraea aridisoli]
MTEKRTPPLASPTWKKTAGPEWSGEESHDRRYGPFTINVEYSKRWHTLTGRHARADVKGLGVRAWAGVAARRCTATVRT